MAIGGFATKQAIEVETQFAKVSTLLDSSQVDFQKYKMKLQNCNRYGCVL